MNIFQRFEEWLFPEHAKVKRMSVDEYNRYIEEKENAKFLATCERLEKLLPKAHADYEKECRRKGDYILNRFFLKPGDYGISDDNIFMFRLYGDRKIGQYHVSHVQNRYSADWLFVEKKPGRY